MSEYFHTPVFAQEVLHYLSEIEDIDNSIVVDCTLGEGGHSELILQRFKGVKIYGFDRDDRILQVAQKRLKSFGNRVIFINDNFKNLKIHLMGLENSIAAFLYDFGISSYHLDYSQRGFAFKSEEKLDMRLDSSCPFSAYDVINTFDENELVKIFSQYGQERFSRRIAKRIIYKRSEKPIETTTQLAEIVIGAIPKKYRSTHIHPATRVFLALRIFVNDELRAIEDSLQNVLRFLKSGGRVLAISFHSLEDKIVKNAFRRWEKGCTCNAEGALCRCDGTPLVTVLTKKPLQPKESEIVINARARSAKLRVCQKV